MAEDEKDPNTAETIRTYGPHNYINSWCACGCKIIDGQYIGPPGLNPQEGACPANPLNCSRLPGDGDLRAVIANRLRSREAACLRIKEKANSVIALYNQLLAEHNATKTELSAAKAEIARLQQIIADKK